MSSRSRSVPRMTVPQDLPPRHSYPLGNLAMSNMTQSIIESNRFNCGGFSPRATIIFPVEKHDHDRFRVNSEITLKNIDTYQWYNVRVLLKYDEDEFSDFKAIHPMDDIYVPQRPLAEYNHALVIYIIDKFRM